MNTMNRGSIRAIRQMLRSLDEILTGIVDAEYDKELANDGGVPIEAKNGCYSGDLDAVSDLLKEAIDGLDSIITEEADWENRIPN